MTTHIPYLTLPGAIFAQPAASILLPIVAGTTVGFYVRPTQTKRIYEDLKQPPFRPPPQVFGPAWTVLYGLMGFGAYRAWTTGLASPDPRVTALAKQGATLFTIQLGLNLSFMPIFFKFGRPVEALVDMVALTGTLGYLTYIWSQVDEVAAWALLPNLAWVTFATYLCGATGYLNDWNIPLASKSAPAETLDPKTE